MIVIKVEVVELVGVVFVVGGDFVEFVFYCCGEVVVDELIEMLFE